MERTCKKCGETKPIEEFVRCKGCKYGYQFTCKACKAEQDRIYSIKNKELISNKYKEYRKKNYDKIKKYKSEWFKAHYIPKPRIIIGRKASEDKYHKSGKYKEARIRYKERNKLKIVGYSKRRYAINKKRLDEYALSMHKKYRAELTDAYIAQRIRGKSNMSLDFIKNEKELIEAKRIQLKLKRLANEERKTTQRQSA